MARDIVIGLGTAGSLIVRRLLADSNDRAVRAVDFNNDWTKLKQHFEVLEAIGSGRLELIQGDATDKSSMQRVFRDVDGAAFFAFQGKSWRSAGKVDHNGVNTAAQAAAAAGVERVLLISSLFVSEKHGRNPLRIMLNTVRWRMMDNKLWGEQRVRECGAPYTIIRPGRFVDKDAGASTKLKSGQGDNINGSISPADVAAICVAAVKEPSLAGVTFEVVDEWAKMPEDGPEGAFKSPEEVEEDEAEGDVAYPTIGPPDSLESKDSIVEGSDDGIVLYPSLGGTTVATGATTSGSGVDGRDQDAAALTQQQLRDIFRGLEADATLAALQKVDALSLQA